MTTAPAPPPPAVIEYARPVGVDLDPRCGEAARWLVAVAVLSGLCVAVCFAAMAWGTVGAALHVLVFAATLATAVRAAVLMAAAGWRDRYRTALDLIAGVGLLGVGVAPVLGWVSMFSRERVAAVALGLAFALMAGTTARHVALYRALAEWAAAARTTLATGLVRLGYAKAVYEGLWLSCCAAALLGFGTEARDPGIVLAVAAFVGCLGYGAIWTWMIVAHVRLAGVLRR
jgi:hypothetical protein